MDLMLTEGSLIAGLQSGIKRTREFIEKITEYQGGSADTEYLITIDIARALLEMGHRVQLEALNRNFCSHLCSDNARLARGVLKSKRTDIAVGDDLKPHAIIEVKIRISSIYALSADLNKISNTIRFMNDHRKNSMLGVSVFQVHLHANRKRWKREHFLFDSSVLEKKLRSELALYAESQSDFSFDMRDLQENSAEGVVDFRAVQTDENSFEIEADGHATRYYAIIIKHKLYGLPINRPSAEWPIRRCAM